MGSTTGVLNNTCANTLNNWKWISIRCSPFCPYQHYVHSFLTLYRMHTLSSFERNYPFFRSLTPSTGWNKKTRVENFYNDRVTAVYLWHLLRICMRFHLKYQSITLAILMLWAVVGQKFLSTNLSCTHWPPS